VSGTPFKAMLKEPYKQKYISQCLKNGKTMNLKNIINAKYFGQDIYAKH
jgi:hypothetical protein